MKVHELITLMQAMPQNVDIEVNDNGNGEVYVIDDIDHFGATPYDSECVIIQVNVD
jgi:hypothetical protein